MNTCRCDNRSVLSLLLLSLTTTAGLCADRPYDLAFSTFFGGSAGEMIRDVEVDGGGNIYVAGTTRSADFPTTRGAYHENLDTSQGTSRWGCNSDIFVAKFSPTGTLLWSTLIGGPNSEEAYGLEIDSKGFVIVHGRGAEGSPVTPGVYQPQFKGCGGGDPGNPHNTGQNAYICKLSPNGSALVWGSFFGIDHLHRDLALDKNDDIYTTWGVRPEENDPRYWDTWMAPAWNAKAFQPQPLGKADCGVAKIASDGRRVLWATYLGGSDYDSIEASIDVDGQGYVYVGLQTRSKDIPTTPGAFDRTYNGGVDWYVAKLSPDGSRLIYGTYIGDEGDNWLNTHNLVVDGEGNCYSSTCAFSSSFPTTPRAVQRTFGGKVDWGIVKLSPTGALLAGTLLGGSAGDNPDGIQIDPRGNLVLFGQTGSADFPTSKDAFQSTKGAGNDAVIAKLSPNLDRILYSTFLGGRGDDNGRAGSVAPDGSLIVAGTTSGGDWPTEAAHQSKLQGPSDALVAKLSPAQNEAQGTVSPADAANRWMRFLREGFPDQSASNHEFARKRLEEALRLANVEPHEVQTKEVSQEIARLTRMWKEYQPKDTFIDFVYTLQLEVYWYFARPALDESQRSTLRQQHEDLEHIVAALPDRLIEEFEAPSELTKEIHVLFGGALDDFKTYVNSPFLRFCHVPLVPSEFEALKKDIESDIARLGAQFQQEMRDCVQAWLRDQSRRQNMPRRRLWPWGRQQRPSPSSPLQQQYAACPPYATFMCGAVMSELEQCIMLKLYRLDRLSKTDLYPFYGVRGTGTRYKVGIGWLFYATPQADLQPKYGPEMSEVPGR